MGLLDSPGKAAVTMTFDEYVRLERPRLERALMARFGVEVGVESAATATEFAWMNWDRLQGMENPTGYLWRVGCTAARRSRRSLRYVVPGSSQDPAMERFDAELFALLRRLRIDERTSVVLVHGYGWTYAEVADLLGVSVSAVTNHVHRGLKRLRKWTEAQDV